MDSRGDERMDNHGMGSPYNYATAFLESDIDGEEKSLVALLCLPLFLEKETKYGLFCKGCGYKRRGAGEATIANYCGTTYGVW
ncbi:hypothetical protein ACROYT_G022081 [Oculina patagonica]